jgi:acetolactate synthase-1/2/3 large subunit
MGARSIHVTRADHYASALRRALDNRAPTVIVVEVALDIKGYRSIWYPYPNNFHKSWAPGPLPAAPAVPAKMRNRKK